MSRRAALALLAGGPLMGLKPENPVVGGTVLRRAAIQSPNFISGSAGWSINQDGSAEFNNVTIRGAVTIGGTTFFYSTTTPQAGKLVASISSPAAGSVTDPAGNVTPAGGFFTYQNNAPSFLNWTATGIQSGKFAVYQATSEAGPWSLLTSIAAGQNASLGPSTFLGIGSGGGTPVIFRDDVSSPRGLQGTLPIVQVDVSTNAAGNNNTAADITTAWSVPASDGVAGTTYTIKALVTVNTGQTTIETLTLGADLNAGTLVPLATLGTAFNGGALNTAYAIPVELVLEVDAAGADTPQIYLAAGLGDESSNRLATNSANMPGHSNTATWTKANLNTIALYAQWGGAGGSAQKAQTLSSRFYREGP